MFLSKHQKCVEISMIAIAFLVLLLKPFFSNEEKLLYMLSVGLFCVRFYLSAHISKLAIMLSCVP